MADAFAVEEARPFRDLVTLIIDTNVVGPERMAPLVYRGAKHREDSA